MEKATNDKKEYIFWTQMDETVKVKAQLELKLVRDEESNNSIGTTATNGRLRKMGSPCDKGHRKR